MIERIGVIQGRLSPRPAHAFQAFPRSSWREEFDTAKALGFDCIEWLFEIDRFEENPLLSTRGRRDIARVVADTEVTVSSICGDFFMECRLAGGSAQRRAQAVAMLQRVLEAASEIGARRVLLPLLEQAHVDTPELRDDVVQSLTECLPAVEEYRVALGLEMEIPGPSYRELIDRFAHPLVGAYYDTGNSAAKGLAISSDVEHVVDKLFAVHVKDRKVGGKSCPLGSGDADLPGFFARLLEADFDGDVVCQHYYGPDYRHDAERSLALVKSLAGKRGTVAA